MLVEIRKIKVIERIRQDITKIDELANDIKVNGLINPITIMQLVNGEYQLLAGLRRLKAYEYLKQEEIEANVVEAKDAEEVLNIEFSENEQREGFTISERLDYAKLIEEIEIAKAETRKTSTLKQNQSTDGIPGTYRQAGRVRKIVAEKAGLGSGITYERMRYIAEHGGKETIEEIQNKKIGVRTAYDKIKATEKENSIRSDSEQSKGLNKNKKETLIKKLTEDELSKNQIFMNLKNKLKNAEIEANLANTARIESERNCKQQISHMNAQIIGMRKRIAELEGQLKVDSAIEEGVLSI